MGTRTIKSSPSSDAGVVVGDKTVRITVNEDKGILVDERGTTINGPVSFVSGTNHLRFGGLWSMSNPMQLTLPSTFATPTPVLVVDPPIKQMESLMKQTTLMIALMGALSAL